MAMELISFRLYFLIGIITIFFLSCNNESNNNCEIDNLDFGYKVEPHAHNDYLQDLPLSTALKFRVSSIEVDIVLHEEQLYVAHDVKDINYAQVFKNMYLHKLEEHLLSVPDNINLLLDLKTNQQELIPTLRRELKSYKHILVDRSNPENTDGKIKIILSGDIDKNTLITDSDNDIFFIDGRIEDLEDNYPTEIVPYISMQYSDLIPDTYLHHVIKETQRQGKQFRLWNTRNTESEWLKLITEGVDIISIDEIEKFYCVMKKNDLLNE